nr:Chain A, V-type proton ATPase subunit G [Saccharomyces cerevisiae]
MDNAGGVGELEKKAEAGVQGELAEIKKIAEKKKDDVVKILIET